MLLLCDMLPKKRMSDDVGSLPYFRFCHSNGLHLRCFPAFMSILIAVHILRSAQLFPSRRWPFPPCSWRLYLIALRRSWSEAVPNSCGSSWILKCQSWAPGRRGGGVWVGSQWECAVTRANPSEVAWIALLGTRLLHPRRCACVARLRPACGLCSASQRAVFPPDSPIRSVSQRMHTVCAPSVVSDSAWLRAQRAVLAPSRGREGAPRNCSVDPAKDPGEKSHSGTATAHRHCFCSKIPETGGQGLWGCHTNLFFGCHQGGSPCDCRGLRASVQFFVFLGKTPECSYCAICVRFLWCMKLA